MPIDSRVLPLGNRLPWFSVKDLDGVEWDPENLPADQPVVIAFLCQHSPYVVHIERHLGALASELGARGVTFLGISPNDKRSYPSDSPEELRRQAERAGFAFPYCHEGGEQAAKAFGAACTPEFYVYDLARRLSYHGRYDSTSPGNGGPTGADLRRAVEATLRNDLFTGDQYPSYGCTIKWTAGNEPSYLLI